jgi:hypothetical protein
MMALDEFTEESETGVECSCGTSFNGYQRTIMGELVDHLIQEHNLFDNVSPPLKPPQATKNHLISEENVRIHQENPDNRNIHGEYELTTGHFLNTAYPKDSKKRYLNILAEGCDVELEFNW